MIASRVAFLRRVPDHSAPDRTLYFSFTGGTLRSSRAAVSMVAPEHMPPDFTGDTGWFEVEKVSSIPWPYWRAVKQVEGPA